MAVFWIVGLIAVVIISFVPLENPEPTPKKKDPFDVLFPGLRNKDR